MAGKVAKVQVAKFPMHDFNDASYIEKRQSGGWNMEENDVLDQLRDQRFQRRVEILEQLLITVRRNGGKLPFSNQQSIFRGLGLALSDSNWDVRLKCIQLINEVIPQFGDGLDSCMSEVMGKLIPNIGESKITVRRAVIQTLHVYMKCTNHVPSLLRAIVHFGLENDDTRVRKESIVALPMLFTPEFARENFFEITQSLAKKLLDTSMEDNLRDCSLMTLEKIKALVGDREFNNYLHKLSPPLRRYYFQLTGHNEADQVDSPMKGNVGNGSSNYSTPRQAPFSKATRVNGSMNSVQQQPQQHLHQAQYVDSYEFGIIPSHVMSQINDQENFKLRAKGVEELRNIMYDLSENDVQNNLMPHMISFISFLNNLLDDSNFKITTVTLEILCILVEKLGKNVKQYLKPLSLTLAKRMGDNKIVVRQAVMKVAIKMMQSHSAKPVLSVICENLQHKNSKVRQETLNIIIAALLTFPSYAFDLPGVCKMVAPTLTDGKRQVRQAALECLSVIAQAMGPGRLGPLVQVVDQVELSNDGEGVMGAVQARLARRQLPKLNSEGLVEYATPVPSSASTRSSASFQVQGADVEWIVGGSQSMRGLSRSDTMELESVTSTPTPTGNPGESNGRPFVSSGKGRKKLPWEGESNGQSEGPPKPRQTWSNSDDSHDIYNKKPIIKRRTQPIVSQSPDDTQQESSYKQIHLTKLRKTQSLKSTNFRGLDLAVQSDKDNIVPLPSCLEPIPSSLLELEPGPSIQLEPIPSIPIESDWDDPPTPIPPPEDSRKGKDDESPFPSKATLARSATRRPTKKVPPISSSDKHSSRDDDADSAYATSLGSTLEAESHIEMMSSLKGIRQQEKMMNSLMSIRSSASKKKEKIIEQQSSSTLTSRSPSPDTLKESGIWSDSDTSSKKKSKNPFESRPKIPRESPFESKPKLARTGSYNNKKNGDNSDDTVYVDYNPSSGVTFRENKNSDVQVVGKGYNEDGTSLDNRSLNGINKKATDKRRVTKGSVLSPLGVASMHSYGSLESEEESKHTSPSPEGIGVVGIGMFENINGTEHAINAGNSQSNDRNNRQPMKQDRKDFTSGVVGVGVSKQGSFEDPSMDILDDVDDDPNNLRMSQKLSDTIAKRKKQLEEENERERVEREKKKQEHDEKLKKERERQQEKLRRLNTSESLGIESLSISGAGSGSGSSSNINTPKTRASPSLTPRKKSKPQMDVVDSSHPLSASSRSPLESDNPEDWKPYKDPDLALRQAHKNMAQDDWETKCGGINSVRRLSVYHKDVLIANLHPVIVAILGEIKNLRSQVSRLAIVCMGDLFVYLTKHMDTDLDMVVRGLLAKNGESNGFIREDSERALQAMVEAVTPQRALIALIAGGATHKNISVRRTTARFLVNIVQRMGPGRVLSGIKDVTDRIIPAVAQFSMDSSQETRYYGRKMLYNLMTHQDFDKMLAKHLPNNTLRNVKEIVESLRIKGIGDGPNETSSARGWRSGHGSRSSSVIRGNSANSETPKRRSNTRTDEATMEEIKELTAMMSANDWRDRYKGITTLLEMCEMNAQLVSSNVIKIFDKFLPRLQDPNSKVNLYALQVMLQIIPILNNSLSSVINMAVGNVSPNLSSKNKEINQTAIDIIDALLENLDGAVLIQPMANQAQSASARSKPHLVETVAELVNRVYPKKTKQVVLHVLPLLWHLLGATNSSGAVQGGSSSIRTATGKLVNSLHAHMGSQLIERASSDPNVTPRHIQLLQELIEYS
ncbi:TOG array regulator of axonemal microtubules protein 1-like isoform X2 [Ruditapes philippinarum]|uniref:TOG array regulator of axonemal microtubules protein 1-like isoform X2 n=1 Tax=Ruditapes philippinarum TaxID=129788 RepID=UPI00295BB2ED|nr:TOG array regulator of axonemal microtubules protein 1-like isoform X2 [Ruditapes philippinarum]